MTSSSFEFLNKIPLFQGLTQDQLMDILRMLKPITYHPGEIIFKEGKEGLAAFIVQEGTVEIFVSTSEKSLVITRFQHGELFGELALIDGSPRSASARALTRSELLCLDKREFDFLRQQFRPAAFHLLREFSKELCVRIRETNEQIEDLLLHGKSEQRGGPVVMSARAVEDKKDESGFMDRFFSLFR